MLQLKVLYFFTFLIYINGQSVSLDGTWTGIIQSCDGNSDYKCINGTIFSAVVPGGIYTDLVNANVIPENFVGVNDIKNRWVSKQPVTYYRTFHVDSTFLKASEIALTFYGLDTFAVISINNHVVGESSNMFLRYIFYVKKYLQEGENSIEVSFSPAVTIAKNLYDEQKKEYIVPPVCVPKEYNGECHVNHIRKMQASFSWDWGPAMPSMGIWKSVELTPVQESLLTDITTDIHKKNDFWEIVVTLFFEVPNSQKGLQMPCHVFSTLHISETSSISNSSDVILQMNEKYTSVTLTLLIPENAVHKWWPNGYGKQSLYKLSATVTTPKDVVYADTRVGFRTVELVEEPLEKGLSFYFRINGIPIFAKGSNFIPGSVFPELSMKESMIRHLLASCQETHMNMLRVWGGGIYESELFYNLADEYGIMIWQDFMFACAMYPTTHEFLNSVREEIVQNVRRLKNHPSIVLWAGNNENEAALYGNWYGTTNEKVYRDDYIKLYVNLMKNEIEQLDTTRPFVVSSPSNGLYTEKYNYTGENPYSNLYGDVHYYNYIKNGWDITQYPRARFSSEYGFQSIPSIYTLLGAAETTIDLRRNSNFMNHRQHLPAGNSFLYSLISKIFIIPQSNDTVRDFIDFIYLSQVHQAVAVKIQTESYRQAMSELNSIGEGKTMGALYWQLNDVWQTPSWSSIDFEGRWKMLHYYAIDFFAPIIITSYLSKANELSLYVVSDELYTLPNCSVKINVYKWDTMTPIKSVLIGNIAVESSKAKKITSMWLDAFLSQADCGSLSTAKQQCIMTLTLTDKNGFQIAPTNYVYPTVLKNVNLPTATIVVKINERHLPGKFSNYPDFEIELTTNNIALFIWLEIRNIHGRFSENGFHMFEERKRIVFHAQEMITTKILEESLSVTTLSDLYNPNRILNTNDLVGKIRSHS